MSMFEYEIDCFLDYSDTATESVRGVVAGKSYSDAMAQLTKYYGNNIEQVNYLRLAESDISVYAFNNSEFGLYKIKDITKEQA